MAETVKIMVTREWVQLSPTQCEVQSVNDRDAYNKTFFDLVVGGPQPSADTDVFKRITLDVNANFHRPDPVWLRLNAVNSEQDQPVIVTR